MQARKTKTLIGGGLLGMQSALTAQSLGTQSQEYKFGWRTHHPGYHKACIKGGHIIPATIKLA